MSFYFPDPSLFGHAPAYRKYTQYAADLEEAGLGGYFPNDPEIRNVAIEMLAEREPIELVARDPSLIAEAVAEATAVVNERRERGE
jgi:hypothetical protein